MKLSENCGSEVMHGSKGNGVLSMKEKNEQEEDGTEFDEALTFYCNISNPYIMREKPTQ